MLCRLYLFFHQIHIQLSGLEAWTTLPQHYLWLNHSDISCDMSVKKEIAM